MTNVNIEELTYCEVHPDRETSLRCNKCNRLMCAECAVQTPVGYRCKQCVRQHEDKFFTATQNDDILVFAVCAGLGGVAGALVSAIGLPLIFSLLIGLPVGGGIAEAALRATKRRRGRHSDKIGAAGVVVGGLIGAMLRAYLVYQGYVNEAAAQMGRSAAELPGLSLDMLFQLVVSDIGLLIFIGLVAAAVYGRFQMKI